MKTNWHDLMEHYHGLENYGDIIKYTIKYAEEHPDMSIDYIIKAVDREYVQFQTKSGIQENVPPHKIIGRVGIDIDPKAVDQFYTAMKMAPVTRGALMPDAHYGYALPIGGVVEYENAIFPAGVGYDIGCQVNLTFWDMIPEELMANRKAIRDIVIDGARLGLGGAHMKPQEHSVFDHELWKELAPSDLVKAKCQLGTLGAGNHFADIVVVRYLETGAQNVGLLTHGGSRKTGYNIAKQYTKIAEKECRRHYAKVPSGYEWLDMDTTAGQDYYEWMKLMVDYASANHQLVHDTITKALGAKVTGHIQSIHNFAEEHVPGYFIHRKGATPLPQYRLGLIPGSSGSKSYIVQGKGDETTLCSSSHGAGRPMSRTQAKKTIDFDAFEKHMMDMDIMYHGVATDETYQAYKDIDIVINLQKDAGMLRPIAEMYPRIVVMGGK